MELLAPAGGIGTALAAFEAGADAVYVGLNKFNARERTENFSFEQLSKLLAFAHKNRKKVHVAVNTLVKESELPEMAEYLARLADLSPDAVIVQDLGVLLLVKRCFPNLVVHASTQMGIHNSAGVEFAAANGAKRVILERQTTLEEVAAIRKKCPHMELEVFAHGALCCALSGGCLMSSYLGGASGNRGKCKQPCRRFYTPENTGKGGYLLSPSDLETLPLLSEFRRLGVDSLKIEGRMKKSDYVKNVVAAYRAALDAPDSAEVAAASARQLARTAGRESSPGFLRPDNFARLIKSDRPGVWGFKVGTVVASSTGGLTVRLEKRLHRGDRVRLLTVYEEDGPALTCASLTVAGRAVNAANPREVCFIPCRDCEKVARGAELFKIGECARDLSAAAEALPEQKIPLHLAIRLTSGELEVQTTNFPIPVWRRDAALAPAAKRKVTAADLTTLFSETASRHFELAGAQVEVVGDLFLPASLGKELRRDFYAFLERNLPLFSRSSEGLARFAASYLAQSPAPPCRRRTVLGSRATGGVNALPLALWRGEAGIDELVLPQFCPESELAAMRRRIERAVSGGIRKFRAANVWGMQLLKGFKNVEVTAAPPLPTANSLAAALLAENGATACEIWTELERDEAAKMLAKSPLPLQQHVYGALELLQSRARPPATGVIADRRGNRFRLVKDPADALYKVLTCNSVTLDLLPGAGAVEDLRYPVDGEDGSFNWRGAWL